MLQFGVSVSLIQPGYVKTPIHNADALASAELVKDPKVNAEMKRLYGYFYSPEKEAVVMKDLEEAEDPSVTSAAIVSALTDKYPKTRYAVAKGYGLPASVLRFLNWILPDRLQDKALL